MDINKNSSFFHDGGIIDIKNNLNKIEISMESSQLLPEWNLDHIPLSNFQTIRGKLHLEGIKSLKVNDKSVEQIKMQYDSGEILNFDLEHFKVKFYITWINYPPKQRIQETESLEIEAEKIYWENIPDLFDPMNE
ncbi:hypothetical protein [Candidatus Protochlamydia phocaeensis]|uniref:hypothetical protein n=1 Tax=Candidatus Protochlamydia phocaeensis TaxID=1414722 RepID=UPI00083981B4|nr:hypothetical protein [Candidatus Protochlamydia phocaeensis]